VVKIQLILKKHTYLSTHPELLQSVSKDQRLFVVIDNPDNSIATDGNISNFLYIRH